MTTRQLSNGAILDTETGKIIANPGGGTTAFTPETSRIMHQRQRAQAARSKLLGLADMARKNGIEIPDPDSMSDVELIAAAGDAIRLLTSQMALTFMDSKNIRGLAEAYVKLVGALDSEPREDPEPLGVAEQYGLLHELAQMARRIEDREAHQRSSPVDTIEGEVRDA